MLEQATRGLLELSVAVLEHLEKRIGLAPLRALQALDRRGPSLVTALGDDMDLLPSIASRLSDRLADAGLITRSVSPTNRRATMLELTDAGRSVLAELITLRTNAIRAITDQMSKDDRDAMLQGSHGFTDAQRLLSDRWHPLPEPLPPARQPTGTLQLLAAIRQCPAARVLPQAGRTHGVSVAPQFTRND
jgi:DNA-binding MarR family transcriptional regulator